MTGGFAKRGNLWSVLIWKFYSAVQIKNDEGLERVEVWESGETIQELVWKLEVNRSLGRSWRRSEEENKVKQITGNILCFGVNARVNIN